LIDLGYPATKIVDEICNCFPLTGWAQQSNVFQTRVKQTGNSLEQLQGVAKGLNMAVVAALESAEWWPIDEVAWQETMQEVSNGWEADETAPDFDNQSIAKKFPIQQEDKIGLIDVFKSCGVNSAFGVPGKLKVDAIDEVLAGISSVLNSENLKRGIQAVWR
jgi:hypothetical protein